MKIEVIQGTNVIGGSIVKIYGKTKAILIDLGESLDGRILGDNILEHALENVDDIFITHYHTDHIALINHPLLENKNIYLSNFTKKVLDSRGITNWSNFMTFDADSVIKIDNLTITPYKSDYSAADSYMFLIDDGLKKVLHTGDFRMHGNIKNAILDDIEFYSKSIDLLIIEGTYYGDNSLSWHFLFDSESYVKKLLYDVFKNHHHNFIYASKTEFPRLKTIASSAKMLDYKFYMPTETFKLYKQIYNDDNVFDFDAVYYYKGGKTLNELYEENFVYLLEPNSDDYVIFNCHDGNRSDISLVFSSWIGYLGQKYRMIHDFFMNQQFYCISTSGHCSRNEIDDFIKIIKPKKILPIHTESRKTFMQYYGDRIIVTNDLVPFEI